MSARSGVDLPRVLGHLRGEAAGPVLVVVGGTHGNEPAGAFAAQRVLAELSRRVEGGAPFRGQLLALTGHRAALRAGKRGLDRDLNRCFTSARVARVLTQDPTRDSIEDREQREWLQAFLPVEREAAAQGQPLVLLDLHTTSSDGPPFSVSGDTLHNRRLAEHLPLPHILGLEESLDGTLLEFGALRGHVALTVESGQHENPAAQRYHEAVIWLVLLAQGQLRPQDLPEADALRADLRRAAGPVPSLLELAYRHPVRGEDGFRMRPGFRGFEAVRRGQLLAQDHRGAVRAPVSGYLLMPLYQAQGSDGFFVIRPIGRPRQQLAAALRSVDLAFVLRRWPGLLADERRPDTWLAQPWARYAAAGPLLQLLGYRRQRPQGAFTVYQRRPQRPRGPDS